MMSMSTLLILLLVSSISWVAECTKHGAQIRLTKKGMQYLADIGKQKLQDELKTTTFDESGKSGRVKYSISETRISEANFPSVQLIPERNVGIKAVLSGATVGASGKVRYEYKWGIIKFKDDIGMSIRVNNVYIAPAVVIGATSKGEPTIGVASCSVNVGSVDIKFHGSWKKWIYNLFRGLIQRKLKTLLNEKLCAIVRKEIEQSARAELQTFPVVRKIDKWAEIDYHLTSSPTYTTDYMDVFVKGEFKSLQRPKESKLAVPEFRVSSEHDKMIYFWLSEYTINTAGEVYQRSKQLDVKIEAWDNKVPKAIRKQLNTSTLQYFIPNLLKYPNLLMCVRIVSRVAPKVILRENNAGLFLFADAIFSMKKKNGEEMELFVFRLEIDTILNVKIVENKIVGKIKDFNYDASVLKSDIGNIDASLLKDNVVKDIVKDVVISRANVQLKKGFPLPQLKHVVLDKIEVRLHKNAVRIATDIYQKKK